MVDPEMEGVREQRRFGQESGEGVLDEHLEQEMHRQKGVARRIHRSTPAFQHRHHASDGIRYFEFHPQLALANPRRPPSGANDLQDGVGTKVDQKKQRRTHSENVVLHDRPGEKHLDGGGERTFQLLRDESGEAPDAIQHAALHDAPRGIVLVRGMTSVQITAPRRPFPLPRPNVVLRCDAPVRLDVRTGASVQPKPRWYWTDPRPWPPR